MEGRKITFREIIFGSGGSSRKKSRRPRQAVLSYESLEERLTPAHVGLGHHAIAHLHAAAHHSLAHATTTATAARTPITGTTTTGTGTTTTPWNDDSDGDSSSTSSTAVTTAFTTLHNDVQTIEFASSTTVGQLTAISVGFQTLRTDGLTPSSESALRTFENTLVTDNAAGTTLTGNATLLSQFEAIYTSSPTAQETTDLTTAYNALAAAVISANITSADITTINTAWSAVLAAQGSTSTASYPYFQLVTGQAGRGPGEGFDGGEGC